jgi:hypothetical protein
MNWKLCVRKRLIPNFKVLSRYSPGGTEKTTKNLTQHSRSPDRDFNLGRPEYEAVTLTTPPRLSVTLNLHLRLGLKISFVVRWRTLSEQQRFIF